MVVFKQRIQNNLPKQRIVQSWALFISRAL